MFGIDLHWMPHCHGSIEVAKILKRLHPRTPVSFGGLSSSIFHEDLIKYDCIDYVFRGDSTEAHAHAGRAHRTRRSHAHARGDLSDIPNLTWKDAEGTIHINPLVGAGRHERHIAGLRLPHERRAAPPRHDQLPAHEGLAALPRDSEPHLPRLRGATATCGGAPTRSRTTSGAAA